MLSLVASFPCAISQVAFAGGFVHALFRRGWLFPFTVSQRFFLCGPSWGPFYCADSQGIYPCAVSAGLFSRNLT